MSKEKIRVVARVAALPDTVEEVNSVLMALIEPTRQEQGCIQYELQQNLANPADFVFVEEWESEASLNTHLNTLHLKEAVDRISRLTAEPPEISRYRLLA